MTIRSIFIGILLGVGISVLAYFNDHIIQQETYLIGSHFPIAVFGAILVLMLLINPLLSVFRIAMLRASEIAIVAALGLAVCGWPGAGMFRYFTSVLTSPATMVKNEMNWQTNHLLAYMPGASALIGEGHVQNWPEITSTLAAASRDSTPSPARRIWDLLPERTRAAIHNCEATGYYVQADKADIVNSFNSILSGNEFYDPEAFAVLPDSIKSRFARIDSLTDYQQSRLNRILLDHLFPTAIMPQSRGEGFLLANGDVQQPVFQAVLQGSQDRKVSLGQVNWNVWWPTLRFWGGLALMLGLASACLVVIVLPQWRRELLAFPIAKFVQEISQPSEKGRLPAVMTSKLFWYGFALIFIIHLVNGIQKWHPEFIKIPLQYNFMPLTALFPNASQHEMRHLVFMPTIIPTIIGFSFFLSGQVSFSLGISGVLFLALFGFLRANGIPFGFPLISAQEGNMLRFGAYLGSAIMVFFVGRHYYFRVITNSLGLQRHNEIPRNAVWATRVLVICMAVAMLLLVRMGLDPLLSIIFLGFMLLISLVMTRINVETGAFFIQPFWVPVGVITVLFGTQAIGPTAFLIMAMVSTMFVLDPREIAMPFIANGMYLATPAERKTVPTGSAVLITVMVALGLVVALATTMYFQHNKGLNVSDAWATTYQPRAPLDDATRTISELSAYNELGKSLAVRNLQRLKTATPQTGYIRWGLYGLALVAATSLLRLLFAWWPLHPVCFLVWGTNPGLMFSGSFLLGWFIKGAVVKMSGVKGYRTIKPFMVGLVAGELIAALTWMAIGAIYYFVTGLTPLSYKVYPL